MEITFDVIIATYNRMETAINLAKAIDLQAPQNFKRIILIDSTNEIYSKENVIAPRIYYYHSNIKNQPFQRFFGYNVSTSDFLLFLDDDMEIFNLNFYKELISFFENNPEYIGLNIPFTNTNEFIENMPRSLFKGKLHWLNNLKGLVTGYPNIEYNKFGYNGVRGERISNRPIQFLSGGAFAVCRKNIYTNFNMEHFYLYNERLGMGEDGLLGYSISKLGLIWAWDKNYILHNDLKNSSYAGDVRLFSKRFLFSRLNLSLEYARFNNHPKFYAILKFYHFAIFRIIASVFYVVFRHKTQKQNLEILRGYMDAMGLAFKYQYSGKLEKNKYWYSLVEKEIKNNKVEIA